MKSSRILLIAGVSVALCGTAFAQTPSVKYDVTVTGHAEKFSGSPGTDHFLSFSAPVQVPRVTLPAGTYLFSRVTPSHVRVMSPDRKTIYSTFLALPAWTYDQHDEIVRFKKISDDAPPRIVGVYPLWSTGFEPIYPKAKKVSKASAPVTVSQ